MKTNYYPKILAILFLVGGGLLVNPIPVGIPESVHETTYIAGSNQDEYRIFKFSLLHSEFAFVSVEFHEGGDWVYRRVAGGIYYRSLRKWIYSQVVRIEGENDITFQIGYRDGHINAIYTTGEFDVRLEYHSRTEAIVSISVTKMVNLSYAAGFSSLIFAIPLLWLLVYKKPPGWRAGETIAKTALLLLVGMFLLLLYQGGYLELLFPILGIAILLKARPRLGERD
ncbi:hypothetical protein EU537_10690 [Candidatus Thorarchaeota archaeon]|nr:MAG: hypothetical protein EU537_10690 [Candidatus Thorarchaeota archaeon]